VYPAFKTAQDAKAANAETKQGATSVTTYATAMVAAVCALLF